MSENFRKIFTAVLLCISVSLFADITSELEFSTNGGKTWHKDFPILKVSNPNCRIRVNWIIEDPETKGNVWTMLYSTDEDFASANQGSQEILGLKNKGWVFEPRPSYADPRSGIPYLYDLHLGERKDGGYGQQWDPIQKQVVKFPLPACPALKPGSHRFCIMTVYWSNTKKKNLVSREYFTILIEE